MTLTMNDQISGVHVYGGGPVRHYVFAGEQQRRRKTLIITALLGFVFALLLAYCVKLVYADVSQPTAATAEPVAAEQVEPAEQTELAAAAEAA